MSDFRDWLSKLLMHGLEYFGLFYGEYEGEVFSVDDPEGLHRIRAKCNALWPSDVDPPDIWCWPAYGPAHKNGGGFHWPLEVGDPVRIKCRLGNPSYPTYGPGWWGENDIADDAGSNVRFLRSPAGFELKIDDETGEMWVSMPDRKAYLYMKENGWLDLWSGTDKGWFTLLPDGSLQHVTRGALGNNRFRINADGTLFIGLEDETRELIRLLIELVTSLTTMTIPTAAGPQPPVNLAEFIDILARLTPYQAPMP